MSCLRRRVKQRRRQMPRPTVRHIGEGYAYACVEVNEPLPYVTARPGVRAEKATMPWKGFIGWKRCCSAQGRQAATVGCGGRRVEMGCGACGVSVYGGRP